MGDMNYPNIKLLEGVGHLPIHYQIKNNLKHAVSSGHLPPNSRLPSVRDLAARLNVAANTVARAYKELQDDGLVVTHVGRGTYVTHLIDRGGPRAGGDASQTTLRSILEPAVASAHATGFSRQQILQVVDTLLADPSVTVGLVGINQTIVRKWKKILETEFADLRIQVVALTLDEVRTNFEDALHQFQPAAYVFSLITTYGEVRALFRGHNVRIAALITELSLATHQALADLPPDAPIGLVCEDMYVNNLLGLIAPYCQEDRIVCVAPEDEAALRSLLHSAGIVLHTIGAKEKVVKLANPANKLIELEFLPNRSCFEQLHLLLIREQASNQVVGV